VNDAILKKLLDLRYQYTTMLGYPNWTVYTAEDKMEKHSPVISDFIDSVVELSWHL
jgi:Zn-dependent oligopeptidase